jgi:tripartite-type tricarboxylate transporter receptor subunit TctC
MCPADRVAAVRAAYVQSLKDPEFIKAVARQGLDIDPISARDLTNIVRSIYAQRHSAVERARDLLPAR